MEDMNTDISEAPPDFFDCMNQVLQCLSKAQGDQGTPPADVAAGSRQCQHAKTGAVLPADSSAPSPMPRSPPTDAPFVLVNDAMKHGSSAGRDASAWPGTQDLPTPLTEGARGSSSTMSGARVSMATETADHGQPQSQDHATSPCVWALVRSLIKPGAEANYAALLASAPPESLHQLACLLRKKHFIGLNAGDMLELELLSSQARDVREIAGKKASQMDGGCSRKQPQVPEHCDCSVESVCDYLLATKTFTKELQPGGFSSLCQWVAYLLVCMHVDLATSATDKQIVQALLQKTKDPTAFATELNKELERLPRGYAANALHATLRIWRRIANNSPAPECVVQAALQALHSCRDEKELRVCAGSFGGGLWRDLLGGWSKHIRGTREHDSDRAANAHPALSRLKKLRSGGRNKSDQSVKRNRGSGAGTPSKKRSK